MGLIIAGTGHRPPRLGLGYDITSRDILCDFVISHLKRLSPTVVISGFAQGWDQALAQAALALGVELWAAIPFKGQESKWPSSAQLDYATLLKRAKRVEVVSEGGYAAAKFIARDRWMVDNADQVLALCDDTGERSGTKQTIDYAVSVGKPVTNLWNEWRESRISSVGKPTK